MTSGQRRGVSFGNKKSGALNLSSIHFLSDRTEINNSTNMRFIFEFDISTINFNDVNGNRFNFSSLGEEICCYMKH